jgi:hypothetical protein
MEAALQGLGARFDKVNVDADPALIARYGLRVPVLTDPRGAELCHGRLDPEKIK